MYADDCSARRLTDPAFEGSALTLAGWTKKVTGSLTMAVGGVGLSGGLYDSVPGDPMAVDQNLLPIVDRFKAGEFDLVGVGRALLQDPQWLHKIKMSIPTKAYDIHALTYLS